MIKLIKRVLVVVWATVSFVSHGQQLVAIQEFEDTNTTNVVSLVRKDSVQFFYIASNTSLPDSSYTYRGDTLKSKTIYFYNLQNVQVGAFRMYYDFSTSSWVNRDTVIIEYNDSTGKVKKITRLYWNRTTNQWDSFQVILCYYSQSKQRFDSIVSYSFDAFGVRQPNSKYVFVYSGSPLKLTRYYDGTWLTSSSSWEWDTTSLFYNSNWKLDSIVSYSDGKISRFLVLAREGNIDFLSNNRNTLWLEDSKGFVDPTDSITFNNFIGDIVEMEANLPFGSINMNVSVKYSSGSNRVEQQESLWIVGTYNLRNYKYYYYVGAPTISSSVSTSQDNISVLITNRKIKVWGIYGTARIITIDGKQIISVSNKPVIDISDLPEGAYMLQLWDTKGKMYSVKFLTR